MPDGPDAREIFEGGDWKWGTEICRGLRAEGLGVHVIYRDKGNRKVEKIDLHQPGDRDESYRIRESPEEELLGYILPVDVERNEFVYIPAGNEQGIIFQEHGAHSNQKYKYENGIPHLLFGNNTSFVATIDWMTANYKDNVRYTLKEDADPSRYMEIVLAAVQSARRRKDEIKQKRGETRKNIFQKLFAGGD